MKQIIFIMAVLIINSCERSADSYSNQVAQFAQIKMAKNELSRNDSRFVRRDDNINTEQIDDLVHQLDQLFEKRLLKKYFYPNMSKCGGGLYGYYQDSLLTIIDATYQGELGFSSRRMYWKGGEIVKIIYREYFPEWDKYEEKYPANKYAWDASNMTYTDTIYHIILGDVYAMQKMAGDKLISVKLDSALIRRLIDCGYEMKNELETEKRLEK